MKTKIVLIIICLTLLFFQNLLAVNTSVEIINGVPVICKDGQPYNISGYTAAWNPDSADEIYPVMDFASSQGFEVIEIRPQNQNYIVKVIEKIEYTISAKKGNQ